MSVRGWLLLLAIYVGYLLLGAFLFHLAECPAEVAELQELGFRAQRAYDKRHE